MGPCFFNCKIIKSRTCSNLDIEIIVSKRNLSYERDFSQETVSKRFVSEWNRLSVNGYARDALIKEIQRARSCAARARVAVDIFKSALVCTPPLVSRKRNFARRSYRTAALATRIAAEPTRRSIVAAKRWQSWTLRT